MSSSPISIRFTGPEDAGTLIRFVKELATYEREPDAVIATEEDFRRQLSSERPPFECLLAEEGERAVGFALFFPTYSTWLGRPGIHLEDLYVPPELRGRGIGRMLLEALARIAVERGAGRLEWAVLDWNQPAIDFYRALGAVPMDEWTTFRLAGDALRRLAER